MKGSKYATDQQPSTSKASTTTISKPPPKSNICVWIPIGESNNPPKAMSKKKRTSINN